MSTWCPDPASDNCYNCKQSGALHIQVGPRGWLCPGGLMSRACMKCGNMTLRVVAVPDTFMTTVMCKLCGKEHAL